MTAFYCVLYWWDDSWGASPLAGGVALVDPLARALSGEPADKWFLYGFAYTLAVVVMGARMAWRYRHSRYQLARTGSVVFFQLALAFLLPNLLEHAHQPEFYFTYFWPLKPEYLLPFSIGWTVDAGSLGRAMILWGALASFVAVPVLTWRFGKRWYCSWVCGCGGLAETLGDPWRQLSDKSTRAWRIERWSIHLVLVAILAITGGLWLHEALGRPWWSDGGQGLYYRTYGFVIGAAFSGVVGVGFYPLLGSRVWCRFGCPQAAILGLLQRFFSRFRITTNGGQCISCGNCSTYCEMGIDVRAYAQRGDNIVRASCVGCGVCAAACPRGVLRLETGPVGDRFPGADQPLFEMLRSMGILRRDFDEAGGRR
jgi:ferredoxin-type protein NapH